MADNLSIVKEYGKFRKANDAQGCAKYLSDDCVISTALGQKYKGIAECKKYIDSNKFEGEWEQPVAKGDEVLMTGTVKRMMMKVKLVATYKFNADRKICSIDTSRA
eukprot:EC120229.1.p1 GENE.EC120229.1~~EC120229.1.p1  ORF type:complete len:106 (+),score=25.92 EC120229.1:183-500(+)